MGIYTIGTCTLPIIVSSKRGKIAKKESKNSQADDKPARRCRKRRYSDLKENECRIEGAAAGVRF